MANNLLSIHNSTIVTGVTSDVNFLVTNINNKNVGIPIFDFSYSTPPIDFIDLLKLDFVVDNVTLMHQATSYGAGIALMVNHSACCFPIFKVDQSDLENDIVVHKPTIVAQLTSWGEFVCVQINNKAYGVPMYNYSSVFPFTSSSDMSAIKITTEISRNTKDVGSEITPSTNLNNKIKTYQGLINRIKYQLGAPFVNLELCDDSQVVDFIDQALEWYTKYAGFTEEFLVFSSSLYTEPGIRIDRLFSITPTLRGRVNHSPDNDAVPLQSQTPSEITANLRMKATHGQVMGMDYDFGAYRKVVGVFSVDQGESTGINTLFTLEQAMAQQTYFSYMLGNVGFDLVTWETLMGWLKLREKVLAQIPYVDFDARNQILRILPAPNANSSYVGAIGAWVEKPVADLIMERWVMQYALAISKIAISNVRGKYASVQLLGGGTINYNDLLSQGLEEKKKLEDELLTGYGEVTPARFFIG